MCSLHLTHPSAHTPRAVGSRHSGTQGAVWGWCLAQGSHLSHGRAQLSKPASALWPAMAKNNNNNKQTKKTLKLNFSFILFYFIDLFLFYILI